jgi:hypothetical protein
MVPHYILQIERFDPEEFTKVKDYLKDICASKGVEIQNNLP